jgi:hypothetical protein
MDDIHSFQVLYLNVPGKVPENAPGNSMHISIAFRYLNVPEKMYLKFQVLFWNAYIPACLRVVSMAHGRREGSCTAHEAARGRLQDIQVQQGEVYILYGTEGEAG